MIITYVLGSFSAGQLTLTTQNLSVTSQLQWPWTVSECFKITLRRLKNDKFSGEAFPRLPSEDYGLCLQDLLPPSRSKS